MGIGMIIIGLASVIIGEALFGSKTIVRATLAVILGAIIYRIVVTLALRASFLETGDMKRSEEHTSELQSRFDLVCRLLLEKKNGRIRRPGAQLTCSPSHSPRGESGTSAPP